MPTSLVQADFILVALNGSLLFFWSPSGKRTRSYFPFPFNGRNSSILFRLASLHSFSPFYSLGQNYSKSNSSSHSSPEKIILSQKSLFSLLVQDEKNLSPFRNPQNISKSNFHADLEEIPVFCSPILYSCRWNLNSVHER